MQLTRESQFDVVNHVSKKMGLPGVDGNDLVPKERRNLSIQSGVHYNILSNHNHEDHALPDDHRDTLKREYTPQQTHKRFGVAPKWVSRDWDVLSNRRHFGHEEQEQQVQAGALDRAATKFFAKNDLNPVTQVYYDSQKEETKTYDENEEALTHGMHSMDIYPPRMKYGPGMAFDIATHAVKDNELFQFLGQKDDEKRRGAYRAMDKRLLEQDYKMGRESEKQRKQGRGVMRISTKRFDDKLDRGYDAISNKQFEGPSHPLYTPLWTS